MFGHPIQHESYPKIAQKSGHSLPLPDALATKVRLIGIAHCAPINILCPYVPHYIVPLLHYSSQWGTHLLTPPAWRVNIDKYFQTNNKYLSG